MYESFFPAGNEVVEHVKTFVEIRSKKSASEELWTHVHWAAYDCVRSEVFPLILFHFQLSDYQTLRLMISWINLDFDFNFFTNINISATFVLFLSQQIYISSIYMQYISSFLITSSKIFFSKKLISRIYSII